MSTEPALDELQSAAAPRSAESPLFRRLFPALAVCSLLGACVLWSLKKQMWADEVFTRTELSDPSLSHLLRALQHLGGGGMPLFSLTAWPWAHLFGLSDLSLRLYSCAGICLAFLVLVRVLSRRVGARAAFLGAAFGLFACMPVMEQNAEARGYGLYLLLCSLAIAQWLRIAETARPGRRDLTLLALTQAGLALGHVLALIFAVLMLAALLTADLWQRRFRATVYLSCIMGWLALLLWAPAIRASMAVGRPHGWIPVPRWDNLALGLSMWLFGGVYYPLLRNFPSGIALCWLLVLLCVIGLIVAGVRAITTGPAETRPIFLLGLALTLGPIIFFIFSRVAAPIYVTRYMLPTALGAAILVAGVIKRYGFAEGRGGVVVASLLLLVPPATAALGRPNFLNLAAIDRIAAARPLVCDWAQDFLVVRRYSAYPALFPLDWPAALEGQRHSVPDFHLMVNYRQEGYLAGSVQDESEILRRNSFLVLDNSDANWFRMEIQNNPQFTWKLLATIDDKHRLLEVQRKP